MASTSDPTSIREAKSRVGDKSDSVRSLFSLDGRTIMITGGVGALGRCLTGAIIESGGDVICIDLPVELPAEDWTYSQAVAGAHSRQFHYYSADITSPDQIRSVFEQIVTHLRSPLRGLVACAGISGNGSAMDYPIDKFRRIIDINLTGTFICAQAAAKEFKRGNQQGSMVLIASIAGHGSNKGVDTAAYNASKAAVHQLARSLAAEWGSRPDCPLIRVNSISPGYIRTAMSVDSMKKPGMEELWEEGNMLNRLSEVDEYRAPVLFLLGDGSSFVTGSDLRVDGGHTAW